MVTPLGLWKASFRDEGSKSKYGDTNRNVSFLRRKPFEKSVAYKETMNESDGKANW